MKPNIDHGKVTFELGSDGWWYSNIGYRCHLKHYPDSDYVDEVQDLEQWNKNMKNSLGTNHLSCSDNRVSGLPFDYGDTHGRETRPTQ